MKKALLPIGLCIILIGTFLRKSDFSSLLSTPEQDLTPITIAQTGNKTQEITEPSWKILDNSFPEPLISTKKIHNVNHSSLYNIFNEEIPESMIIRGDTEYDDLVKTAYQHTFSYPELWLKITLHNIYTEKQNDERIKNILTKNENKLITQRDESITKYTKDPDTKLLTLLQEKHLNSWCKAVLEEEVFDDLIFGNYNKEVYTIRPKSGSFDSRKIECYPDDENHEDYMTPVIYFESQDQTSYYKLRKDDGCAPGPCSIFAKIEAI